jgi:hypothetical protein
MNQNKYNLELKNQFYKNTHTHVYIYINLSQMYIFSEQHPRVKHFLLKYIFKQQK